MVYDTANAAKNARRVVDRAGDFIAAGMSAGFGGWHDVLYHMPCVEKWGGGYCEHDGDGSRLEVGDMVAAARIDEITHEIFGRVLPPGSLILTSEDRAMLKGGFIYRGLVFNPRTGEETLYYWRRWWP